MMGSSAVGKPLLAITTAYLTWEFWTLEGLFVSFCDLKAIYEAPRSGGNFASPQL